MGLSCEHERLPVIGGRPGPCAHPGCPEGFAGAAIVTAERVMPSSSALDFLKIYIGPDGMPMRGRSGRIRRTYHRVRVGDEWRFAEPEVVVIPAVSDEEACRAAWAEAALRATGTDEEAT